MKNKLLTIHDELQKLFLEHKEDIWDVVKDNLALAQKEKNKIAEYHFLHLSGSICSSKGQYFKALNYLEAAKQLCLAINSDRTTLARIYNSIGILYKHQHKMTDALNSFFEGLQLDVIDVTPIIYNNIATIYLEKKNYAKASLYLQKIIAYPSPIEKIDLRVSCYLNMGIVHFYNGLVAESITAFNTALSLAKTHGLFYKKAHCLHNLACVYEAQKNYTKAIEVFKTAIRISEKYNLPLEALRNRFYIASIYLKDNQVDQGIKLLKNLLSLAQKEEMNPWVIKILNLLKNHYEKEKDYTQAYFYASELILLQNKTISSHEEKAFYEVLETKEKEILTLREQKEQIAAQNILLANTNKELRQYAYIVAHDLKEPLRGICSFSELLLRRYKTALDVDAQDFLSYIYKGANHMNTLLSDLLIHASLEKQEKYFEIINMEELACNAVENVKSVFKNTDAAINITHLPRIVGHQEQLRIILENLIANAIKFRKLDTPCAIEIGYKMGLKTHTFFVKDNGIGIHPNFQNKIFKIFQRLDKKNFTGTGIGLAICQKIAEFHKGEIWVESAENEGSTFYFSINKSLKIPTAGENL